MNQSVVFAVDHMKVQGDWAFLIATQQKRSGGKIDYRGTKYELYENECTCALVRRRGDTWVVVDSVYFMSDVWCVALLEKGHARRGTQRPRLLFSILRSSLVSARVAHSPGWRHASHDTVRV